MSIDFGRAPRGDPRLPHANERVFSTLLVAFHGAWWIAWGRGRLFGIEYRPRRYDLDLLQRITRENKQKRQIALGQVPTYRTRKPSTKWGEKHGWGPAWYRQYFYNSWMERRMGPAW